MDDPLTKSVLGYQRGELPFERLRDLVVVEVYTHLIRYRRKGEDEVSEFLVGFYDRVEGLVNRFQDQGLPFRHYLLRTLRWQWQTFRADRAKRRRQVCVAIDAGLGTPEGEDLAEPTSTWELVAGLSPASQKRLILLALKAAPWLEERHLEAICERTGTDLAWLQGRQQELRTVTDRRRGRRERLVEKRSEAYYRRLLAEDEARREVDPERRQVCERRAARYRSRLVNLSRQQDSTSTSPTHLELAHLLGMPKGSVDSGLYHLKKKLACVYSVEHDDLAPGDQQPPQKDGI